MSPRLRLSLLVVFLAGFGLRVVSLDGFGLWLDELIQVHLAKQALHDYPLALAYGANMPVDFLITKAVIGWGEQDFWLRMPAVFFGVISIALIFNLSRSFLPAPGPWFSALLLGFSPLAVQYSRELRPYSLFLTLTLLSTWFYLAASRRPAAWVGYVFAMLALLHTHLFGLALLPVHALHWLVTGLLAARRRRRLHALIPGAAAFVVILTVFLLSPFRPDYLFRFGRALVQGLSGPTAAESLQIAAATSIFPNLGELVRELPLGLSGSWPWGLPMVAAALLGLAGLRKRPAALSLLLLWLLAPPCLILYSLAQRNQFYSPRYLIVSLPPLLILAASGLSLVVAGLSQALRWTPARRALPYLAALLLVLTFAPNLASAREPFYENWRDAAAYLRPRLTSKTAVVIPAAAAYLQHYLPGATLIDAGTLDQIAAAVADGDDIYLLQSPYSQFSLADYPWLTFDYLEAHFAPAIDLYHFPADVLSQDFTASLSQLPPELTAPSPADHIDALREFARQARSEGNWPAAIAALQVLIPLQSSDGGLWAELGFAYQQSNQTDGAIRAYRRSLTIDDSNPWAHLLLSNLLRQAGQPAEALEQGRRAVELAPDLAAAWAAWAYSLYDMGQFAEALATFDQSLALLPNDLDLRVGRATAATAVHAAAAADAWRAVLDLTPPPDIAGIACAQLANDHPACNQ